MKLSPLKWQYSEERPRETEKEREKRKEGETKEDRKDKIPSILFQSPRYILPGEVFVSIIFPPLFYSLPFPIFSQYTKK